MSVFKNMCGAASPQNELAMWVKAGCGGWYAIPPSMADSFRKAGAEVRQAHELPQQGKR